MMQFIKKLKAKNSSSIFLSSINIKKRTIGQGMVEFALVLPILLLVVYGLLETGRLLFIYGSTVTAARQAARYGSATGDNSASIPFYRDCAGIDSAATRVGFINTFDDINVTYDRGLDASGNVLSIPGISSDPTADTCDVMNDTTLQNGDRIKVQVTTQWEPIIAIVPSWQGFTITSSAERTILMTVPIGVDPDAQQWVPGGALQLVVTSTTPSFDEVGDIIQYTYTLTNTGTFDLHGPFSVTDNRATVSCASAPGTLSPGGSFTCSGTYTVKQSDLDAGFVTNQATGSSIETTSNPSGVTVLAIQNKLLELTKTASQDTALTAGTVITYTYKLKNVGNVTLVSPYSVTDNKIASVDCSSGPASLAPGASFNCTGVYSITNSDLDNGSVTNTASGTATFGGVPVTSNTDDATVNTSSLQLKIQPSTESVNAVGQVITYLYTLKNIGNVPLNNPYQITDNLAVNISCPTSNISPGQSITCQGEHVVTQADIDAETPIVNQAFATSDGGVVRSNVATATVTITPGPELSLTITPSQAIASTIGTSITYSYILTNTGNITLQPPFAVTDQTLPGTPVCSSNSPLGPGQTTSCTLSYTVTQQDLDRGSIVNTAYASAESGTILSTQATGTVITYNAPRLTLSISSDPSVFTSAGTILNFKFTLQNTGNSALIAPYTITANGFLGAITCPNAPATLAIGQQVTCTAAPYTTTPSDATAKKVVVTAEGQVSGTSSGSPLSSNSATLTVSFSFQCFVYHRLSTTLTPSITYPRQNQMEMSVINDNATGGTLFIEQIQLLNWNFSDHAQQYVSTIFFGGVQIATGNISQRTDPVTYSAPFSGNVSLAPGQTKTVLFTFNKIYNNPTGNEIIIIKFTESGCPLLNSSNNTQVK